MLTYNHGPYIRKAIEGVLSQKTDFPVELLIGEDHSSDNTLAITREYERAYPETIRVITSDSNVGAKANLRRLEASCRAKYVAYCEGDDYWHDPSKLKKQVEFLETNPDYSLVHTEFQTKHVKTGRIIPNAARQPKDLNDADAFNDLLSGRRLVLTLTVCARAAVLNAVLAECPECYDPRFQMGDTQRWLELARRGKVKCLHEVTATHLILLESASQSRDPKRALRFILSTKEVLEYYIEKYGCPQKTKAAAMSRASIGVLACAYASGDFGIAQQSFIEYRKLRLSPKLQPALYYLGSRAPWLRYVIRPCLVVMLYWSKFRRRIGRLFREY